MFASDISPVDLHMNGCDVKEEIIKEEKEEEEDEEEEDDNNDDEGEEVDHMMNGAHDMKKVIQKQDSVHSNDTDTNSAGSYVDSQSVHYSSDDKHMDSQLNDEQKENGKKKLSRRHYLPSDELERLRKRERETKRRQRERHRLANTESASPVFCFLLFIFHYLIILITWVITLKYKFCSNICSNKRVMFIILYLQFGKSIEGQSDIY